LVVVGSVVSPVGVLYWLLLLAFVVGVGVVPRYFAS
jgi:hypothetical protein